MTNLGDYGILIHYDPRFKESTRAWGASIGRWMLLEMAVPTTITSLISIIHKPRIPLKQVLEVQKQHLTSPMPTQEWTCLPCFHQMADLANSRADAMVSAKRQAVPILRARFSDVEQSFCCVG